MTSDASKRPGLASVIRSPVLLLATVFGSGLSPVAPGTAGSLASLPVIWLVLSALPAAAVAGLGLGLLAVGAWVSGVAGQRWGKVDHGAIVIDELVGLLLTVAIPFYLLDGWVHQGLLFAAGFVTFRLFDIVKPWPASWFDRHAKNGWGVMLDDVAAGLWAGLLLVPLLMLTV